MRTAPFSQRWVRPNAQCPVCGAAVYFYSNEHGSRVFFDEMGPPWPKHPCTLRQPSPASTTATRRTAPGLYTFADGRRQLSQARRDDRLYNDAAAYRQTNGEAWVVLDRWVDDGVTLLKLHRTYDRRPPQIWRALDPVDVTSGSIVFMWSGLLSYVDAATLEVTTVRMQFVRSQPRAPLSARLRAVIRREPPALT
ncbi:hypothetical protein HIR71_02940 [Cellulomonas fimi]|uniref:Uncharacterized protein n=1 Tax=Cellulomonas fimi TaxID=1708 RepID=A0A7Y0LVV4_CELFI|nr:hypothetical protein [Cellulomonas fimi]